MKHHFHLSAQQLIDVALHLERRIVQGLTIEHAEIQCLPAYVPAAQLHKNSRSMVLDLGGSMVRSALISWTAGAPAIVKGPLETTMPWQRNVSFEKEKYFQIQSDLIARLSPEQGLPLGYCFSYPTQPTRDRDAVLLKWTKEVYVPGTEGHRVGHMLLEHLHAHNRSIRCSRVTVINDTIAGLFAALAEPQADAFIGLVVGTGTNMATFINAADVPKLPDRYGFDSPLPINLESGNFTPPYLTEWDQHVDNQSENPGCQRFEKAVSGAYLGRLFKTIFPKSNFDPATGARELVHRLNNSRSPDDPQMAVARQIYDRSAQLVGAALAGLIKVLNHSTSRNTVKIVAEGSLFWSRLHHRPHYADLTQSTLIRILSHLDLGHISVDFVKIKNANLLGAGLAAITE
jgi:hexokinase